MESTLTFLTTLQAMSTEHPVGFAIIVILAMVSEGLLLVGVINLLLKTFFRSSSFDRYSG